MSVNTAKATAPHWIVRFVMGILNFFMPFVFLISFSIAAIFSATILLMPEVLLMLLPLMVVALFSGTYSAWHNAHTTQAKMLEKVRVNQAAQTEVDPEDLKAATMSIPTFGALLKRNALFTLFYAPLVAIISSLAMGAMMSVMDLIASGPKNRGVMRLVATILIPVPLFGWLAGVMISASRVSGWVDRRLLKASFELPEDDEVRQKRKMREALTMGAKKPFAARMREGLKTLGQVIGFMVMTAGPIILAAGLMAILPLPVPLMMLLLIPFMLGWPFYMMYRFLFKNAMFSPRDMITSLEKDVEKAATPEERQEMQTAIKELQRHDAVTANSIESLVMRRMMLIMLVTFGGVMITPFLISLLLRLLGASAEVASGAMLVLLIMGVGVVFFVLSYVAPRFMPKGHSEIMLADLEDMLREGKNGDAIALVEKAMEALPNWETMIPAAAAYATAGYPGKAKQLAQKVMLEFTQNPSEMMKEMAKIGVPTVLNLLTEIALSSGDYVEAQALNKRAQEFPQDDYSTANTQAHLYLRLGQPDLALPFLDKAAEGYQKENKPVSPMSIAYRAWAVAQKGDVDGMKTLYKESLNQVNPSHKADLAELHLIGGFIARDLKKPASAAKRFESAIQLNPNGVIGHQARIELEMMA